MAIDVITTNTTVQNATADNQYTGVDDGQIAQSAATSNGGTFGTFEINKYDPGDHKHALIRFDGLSNVPSTAIVSTATLYLYQDGNSGSTHSISVRRMLQAWTEAGFTWNTYDGTNTWNTGGALGAGTDRVSTEETSASIDGVSGYKAFVVTSLVQDIVDGTIASDEGFHLERTDAGEDNAWKLFTSAEGTDGQRPELVVEYTIGPAQSVTDINTDEIIEDGEQNVTFTTSGFSGEISSFSISNSTYSTSLTGITSTSGAGDADAPDVTTYTVNTPGAPFSHNSAGVSLGQTINAILGGGTSTAPLAVEYRPKAGYEAVAITSARTTQGSMFEFFTGDPIVDTSQVLFPEGTGEGQIYNVQADGTFDSNSSIDVPIKFWDASDGFYKPFDILIEVTGTDDVPDAFSFTDRLNVAQSTVIESNVVTVAGIDTASAISVDTGEYRINAGAYTSLAGTVNNGDTIQLRQTSSPSYSTPVSMTLDIGGITDNWQVITEQDPNAPASSSRQLIEPVISQLKQSVKEPMS
jgi:hypothetical protein